jgi:N-acetylglucosaminyl-diphospho-decaprenol L-rhamnosyltransferase
MSIASIIVNYRTPKLTRKAVASLLPELQAWPGSHVYLVDNASGDDSVPLLTQAIAREGWRDRVTLLPAPRNGGFGYGVNLAVRPVLGAGDAPEYFYLLNPDAEVEPGSLARLLAFADQHREVGLVGSHIRGPDGRGQVAAFRFPSLLGEIENAASIGLLTRLLERHTTSLPLPDQDCQVDWISGTSMLIRRSTFETVGLFDEEFFLYFEEVDFCRRARLAGIPSWFVAGAPITHVGAASTGMLDETRPMPAYWFASRHRYFRKHHGAAYAAACDVARMVGMLAWRSKERMVGRPGRWRPHLLRDLAVTSWKHLRAGP